MFWVVLLSVLALKTVLFCQYDLAATLQGQSLAEIGIFMEPGVGWIFDHLVYGCNRQIILLSGLVGEC